MPTLTEVAQAIYERQQARPIGEMTISEFGTSGRTVRIWSDVIGETVVFAADNADVSELPPEKVVYRSRELAELCRPGETVTGELLRLIHLTKKIFTDARIVSDNI